MPFPRSSGILLHPTSLPGRYGIGDLGLEAYQFVDFLSRSAQRLWQVLPLGPTGFGNSPYMCFSAMAGNPLLISPDLLKENELLSEDDLREVPDFPSDRVDFDRVIAWKIPLLRKAARNFAHRAIPIQKKEFEGFCMGMANWLEDYALFVALLETQEGAVWTAWPEDLRHRKPEALNYWRQQLAEEIFFQKFLQYEFFRQWSELKSYANAQKIRIIGDIPIYVSHNSADVWEHPEIFKLDPETGEPAEMAGVPPDYFSETGQLWGNPIYNWEYLESTNFTWWIERIRELLAYVDLIRIDHFRGFESYWSVPAGEKTAINGEWTLAPGKKLFKTIRDTLGSLPILAEDLGVITPEVEELRDTFEFPGMSVLLFAFGGDSGNNHLPHHYTKNSLVYTGTHDNDTAVGWWHRAGEDEKKMMLKYLGYHSADEIKEINWLLIRIALSTVANQAIIPLQDILGLDNAARMNTPGTIAGNWEWRYSSSELLNEELQERLLSLTQLYSR